MHARRIIIASAMAALSLLAIGCSSGPSGSETTGSTLAPLTIPSSTTVRGAESTVPTTDDSPTVPRPLTPTAVLGTLTVRQVGSCEQGRGRIQITHDPEASSILRQITGIVDGAQASTDFSSGADRFEIDGVNCDGTIHTVLLATVDRDGGTQSRAFAVRMS